MDERGAVIKRVFRRYGLPVFMDRRRSVDHNPVVEFILALPRIAASGRRYDDVFTLLKTGLTGIGRHEIEEVENYVVKYRIAGGKWGRDFTFGLKRKDENGYVKGDYEQEELDALNATRVRIVSLISGFEKGFKGGRSAGERTEALLTFLTDSARLPEMIESYADELESAGMLEYAAEMSGIWDVTKEILEQMSTVLGDLPMSMDEYATVLRTGLDSVRVGVLPTAVDQIVLGTMQRTRSGNAKAVFVLGANDGVLPASSSDGAIFSEDEVYRLADAGYSIARTEDTTHMEEELAIYRNLSKPSALLRVSYAASDSSGRNLAPSPVFERLRRLFPDTPVEKDIRNVDASRNPGAVPPSIRHPDQTMDYLSGKLRTYAGGGDLPEVWKNVMAWYRANKPDGIARVEAGIAFRGRRERVDARFVDGLYRKVTSPSALEKYSRCPFAWFMSYGVGLRERRVAGMDSRSIGDVYHNVLLRLGQELSADGLPASDKMSRWQTITDDEIDSAVARLVAEEYPAANPAPTSNPVPALMSAPDNRSDETISDPDIPAAAQEMYRMGRVERTAALAARVLTQRIREGRVESILFETPFGVDAEGEGRVRIEGRIDRVDILDGGYACVVDYKSGADEFSIPDAAAGYQLQLMIYLNAVSDRYKPAGVFYFRIKEPRIEDGGNADGAWEEIMKNMKPDGVAIDDARALKGMGIDPDSRAKKGRMEAEAFEALRTSVSDKVSDLVKNMSSGCIDADPKSAVNLKAPDGRNRKACDYCSYKGICNFDPILYVTI
jgi:ATP-dependent helicase/nuclease subunit B